MVSRVEWRIEAGDEFLLPIVADKMLERGISYQVGPCTDTWFGVTYKEDKPGVVKALKALVDKGEYKEGLY